jgi:hypothetical protein
MSSPGISQAQYRSAEATLENSVQVFLDTYRR